LFFFFFFFNSILVTAENTRRLDSNGKPLLNFRLLKRLLIYHLAT